MVFATEFDPIDQPQSASKLRQAAANAQVASHSASPQPTQRQAHSLAEPQIASTQRVYAVERAKPDAVSDNVVPLHLESEAASEAIRVRSTSAAVSLPQQSRLPAGLKLLNRINQCSTVVTSLLVTSALVLYGSTVYVDKSTNRALAKLDALQGESQQLTTANEAIKHSLAEQATQAESGLEPYEAGDMLFVAPAPRRDAAVKENPATEEMPQPLGY